MGYQMKYLLKIPINKFVMASSRIPDTPRGSSTLTNRPVSLNGTTSGMAVSSDEVPNA